MLAVIAFACWLIEFECAIMTTFGKPSTVLNHLGQLRLQSFNVQTDISLVAAQTLDIRILGKWS